MKSLFVAFVIMFFGYELQYEKKLESPVPTVIIHHSVSPACNTDDECLREINNLRNYFVTNGLGFGDIPYSFLIGGNGKVYEGSGFHNAGAHTRGHNTDSIGIAFIGDFRKMSPTPEALAAAQELLSFGLQNKNLAEDYRLVGAKQLLRTESPGNALQEIIKGWPHWAPTSVAREDNEP